jgi:hypothetical protein
MDRTVRGTIAVIIIAAIVGIAVYGSYLPMRKAQSYIAALQSFQATPPTSLQDLEGRLTPALDAPSPIGQEEIVRNTANSVLGLLQQGSLDATSTSQLMDFLNTYYAPILQAGRGMSFGQDLYLEGAVNEVAFSKTGDPTYLLAAQKYYEEGEQLGPNRPQPLYGLFDVYRAEGNVTSTIEIANKITANWPSDMTVSGALSQFLTSMGISTSSVKGGSSSAPNSSGK